MAQSKTFCDLTVRQYKSAVAKYGCILCAGRAELHHIRAGMGAGQRNDDWNILPLCPAHHRTGGHGVAFHAGQKTWEKNYGTEIELQAFLNEKIAQARR